MKEQRNYRLKVQINGYSIMVTEDTIYDLCVATKHQLDVIQNIIRQEPVLNIFLSFKNYDVELLKENYKSSKWFPSDLDTSVYSAFNQCVESLGIKELLTFSREPSTKCKSNSSFINLISLEVKPGFKIDCTCTNVGITNSIVHLLRTNSCYLSTTYSKIKPPKLTVRKIQKENLNNSCILYRSDECLSISLGSLVNRTGNLDAIIAELSKFSFIGGESND